MINTFNESHLHKALKTFYAVQFSAQEEVKVGRWICDLVKPDGSVVEIQTRNVNSLKEKIFGLLNEGRRVTVVRPIVREKIIETYSQDGSLVSRRKSPKKESVYAALSEFTGLAPLLCDKRLAVLFPEISAVEKRAKLSEPEQSKNKRRRFKKDWQKTGKALLTIGGKKNFAEKTTGLASCPKKFWRPQKRPQKKTRQKRRASQERGQPAPALLRRHNPRRIFGRTKKRGRAQREPLVVALARSRPNSPRPPSRPQLFLFTVIPALRRGKLLTKRLSGQARQ